VTSVKGSPIGLKVQHEEQKEITMSALNEKPNAERIPATGPAGMIIDGRYLPPPEDKDGKLWVRSSALIQRGSR